MSQFTLSLAQMNIQLGDVDANLATFRTLAERASRNGSQALILPELWTTGYVLPQAADYASTPDHGTHAAIQAVAREHQITIIGSLLETVADGVANSLAVIAPDGTLQGIYRKVHLFRLFDEEQHLEAGYAPLVLDMPWGKTGYAICYDLRFPELFRMYCTRHNAKVLIIPAEWPAVRVDHWRSLLIARAIENQAYVIACNSVGATGDKTFAGHSMIIDPWGKIVMEAGATPQLLTATIDTDLTASVRATIPIFEDIRRDIYGG